jgi:isoleucyl-tRNA synthetase
LSDFPVVNEKWNNAQLEEDFTKILKSREVVSRAIEPLRADKKVGSSLEVAVWVKADDNTVLKANEADLADIYIVSQAHLADNAPSDVLNEHSEDGYTVWVTKAEGEKCVRCWKYRQLNEDGICADCAKAVE